MITRTLETTPKDATHWSTRSLAAELGLVTVDGVAGLGAFGLQPQRQDLWKLSRNPLFIDKVRDVVGLDLDVRGLTTRRLRHHRTTFEITIDFIDHALIVRTTDDPTRSFELGSGPPVADFDARIHATLVELGINVDITEKPFSLPMTTPFPQDVQHASWDHDAITRFGPGLVGLGARRIQRIVQRQDQPRAPVLAHLRLL